MFAALAATLILGGAGNHIDMNTVNQEIERAKDNGCVIVGQVDMSQDDLLKELERLGIDISDLLNCPDINIPGMGQPETDAPETNAPETNAPETNAPETNAPETNVPETEPETNAPETNAPETNAPETNAPETNAPETNAPETNAPETNRPQEANMAEKVVELVNQERKKAGLSPVEMKSEEKAAAQVRAGEIEKSFSHTRPDGRGFSTALTEQGAKFRGAGENIAWGQKTPEEVMTGWMNSEGHRANILNASFKYIGVGYHVNSGGTAYWTQLFTY